MNISILQSSLPFCEKPILSLFCNIGNPRITGQFLNVDIHLESRHLFPEHAERPIGVMSPQFLETDLSFTKLSSKINSLSLRYHIPIAAPIF